MAIDTFLKIDGIDGESQDSKHKGEIEVLSWSFGASQSGTMGTGGGGGAGKVNFQDFHITLQCSKASPKLFLTCAGGDHIKTAVLVNRKAGKDQHEYYTYKFSDLLVSSFQTGGHSDGGNPVEQVSFNFTKVEVEYKEQKPDGTLGGAIKSGWNVKENKAV